MVQRILIHKKTGKQFLVKDSLDHYHTQYGVVPIEQLRKMGIVISEKGDEFLCIKPTFSDLWNHFSRGPQQMISKDIGMIIAKTGIGKETTIIDAGGGIGALGLSLANIAKQVSIYEQNPEHYAVVQKNLKLTQLKNVTLHHANIYERITEKNVDVITLDLPEPWQVIPHAELALRPGGFLITYLPNLTQVQQFLEKIRSSSIKAQETIELIERKWKITDKIMRPEFQMLGHTGFLTFCRRF